MHEISSLLYAIEHGTELYGRRIRMRRRGQRADQGAALAELDRIKSAEQKLREAKIALLKAELAKARRVVRSLEKELRVLGDREATRSAGRIAWDEIYDQLGSPFTATEMAALTGASSNLVGSIVHRWKRTGRIVPTDRRAVYRKAASRTRKARGF
jgi:multidrug efflux pump subunit AcrA (membrane-fusion protein)